jgi:hypothetical protein
MICEDETKEEFEAVFSDDSVIKIPIYEKVVKAEDTEEEKFEEICCHEKAMSEKMNEEDMLEGDFSLKENLKTQLKKPNKSHFPRKKRWRNSL